MTTFAYTITLDDSERIMLEFALKLTIEHCQSKLDNGEGAPYWAHRHSAQEVLERLNDDVVQTSGNNFHLINDDEAEIIEAFDHANKFKAGELTGQKIIEAVKSNNADEVNRLITLSADDGGLIILRLTQKDKDGRTAFQIAEANNNQTIIEILRGQGK